MWHKLRACADDGEPLALRFGDRRAAFGADAALIADEPVTALRAAIPHPLRPPPTQGSAGLHNRQDRTHTAQIPQRRPNRAMLELMAGLWVVNIPCHPDLFAEARSKEAAECSLDYRRNGQNKRPFVANISNEFLRNATYQDVAARHAAAPRRPGHRSDGHCAAERPVEPIARRCQAKEKHSQDAA